MILQTLHNEDPRQPDTPGTILIVDDEPVTREM